jgi:hypothetical protein
MAIPTSSTAWLWYLRQPAAETAWLARGSEYRNMWCTAGFFHAAGFAVTVDGEAVPLGDVGDQAVFTFEPIDVVCDEQGRTRWQANTASTRRFIFRVTDPGAYAQAMTRAMSTLLRAL